MHIIALERPQIWCIKLLAHRCELCRRNVTSQDVQILPEQLAHRFLWVFSFVPAFLKLLVCSEQQRVDSVTFHPRSK